MVNSSMASSTNRNNQNNKVIVQNVNYMANNKSDF